MKGLLFISAIALLSILLVVSVFIAPSFLVTRLPAVAGLVAKERSPVVAQMSGRLAKVLVKHGQKVSKGDVIAAFDSSRLETELANSRQEKSRLESELDRTQRKGDRNQTQTLLNQLEDTRKLQEKIWWSIIETELRSPTDGVFLSKNIEQRVGEFIQMGTKLGEVVVLR